MNEIKEEQTIISQNINLINTSPIKVSNGNKEKNNINNKKFKIKKQTFINSTSYNLQKSKSNLTLHNKYFKKINKKRNIIKKQCIKKPIIILNIQKCIKEMQKDQKIF